MFHAPAPAPAPFPAQEYGPPQHHQHHDVIQVVNPPTPEYLPPQIQQLPLQDTNVNFHGVSSSAVASGSIGGGHGGGGDGGYHYDIGHGSGHF